MARASTSGFITMPGPPPAGVSSTERCRSLAWARISIASSDHTPLASALPARLMPSGPGNISGNRVRTVARHMAPDSEDFIERIEACVLLRSSPRKRGPMFSLSLRIPAVAGMSRGCLGVVEQANGRLDHQPPGRDIDHRHDLAGERHHDGLAGFGPHLDQVAGTEIVHRHDGAERAAVWSPQPQVRSGRHDRIRPRPAPATGRAERRGRDYSALRRQYGPSRRQAGRQGSLFLAAAASTPNVRPSSLSNGP